MQIVGIYCTLYRTPKQKRSGNAIIYCISSASPGPGRASFQTDRFFAEAELEQPDKAMFFVVCIRLEKWLRTDR